MDTSKLTTDQLHKAAIEAIVGKIGIVGLIRLLRDQEPRTGDYTADREQFLPSFDSDEAFEKAITEHGYPEVKIRIELALSA